MKSQEIKSYQKKAQKDYSLAFKLELVDTREQAIINLQNNVYGLQNSLVNGNQRVATVNVSF